MSSDTPSTDSDTDLDRTAIDLHRGSQQSVVAVDRGPYTVCVLVDDDSKLPADEVERALRAHAADLAAVTAVESGYFDTLPPADESVEQALDGPLRADGAGAYRCVLCGRGHPTTGAALACCSERFDDADLVTDGGLPRHPETITVGTLDERDRATLRYKPPAMRAVADVLDGRDPMTADEVAAESDLHESTVRTNLGALVREGIAARAPYIPRPQRSVYYIPGDAAAESEGERLVPDGGVNCSPGRARTADKKYRVEENPSGDEFFTGMLRIQRSHKEKVNTLGDGEASEEIWVEGTLANIPKKDGYGVLEALADYYDCEVRGI